MKKLIVVAVIGVLSSMAAAPARAGDKSEALARKVVENFFEAFNKGDVDGVMKLLDVPFGQDGREIIEDKDKLRQEVANQLGRNKKVAFKIVAVATWKKLADDKKVPPKRKVSLDELIGKNGLVALVEVGLPNGKTDNAWMGIRIEADRARIVGILD